MASSPMQHQDKNIENIYINYFCYTNINMNIIINENSYIKYCYNM